MKILICWGRPTLYNRQWSSSREIPAVYRRGLRGTSGTRHNVMGFRWRTLRMCSRWSDFQSRTCRALRSRGSRRILEHCHVSRTTRTIDNWRLQRRMTIRHLNGYIYVSKGGIELLQQHGRPCTPSVTTLFERQANKSPLVYRS